MYVPEKFDVRDDIVGGYHLRVEDESSLTLKHSHCRIPTFLEKGHFVIEHYNDVDIDFRLSHESG